MPLIYYACECGNGLSKFFRQPKDAPALVPCKSCDKNAKKALKAPSSTSIIVVDNGVQAKRVEVNLEVVESIEERSTKNFNGE